MFSTRRAVLVCSPDNSWLILFMYAATSLPSPGSIGRQSMPPRCSTSPAPPSLAGDGSAWSGNSFVVVSDSPSVTPEQWTRLTPQQQATHIAQYGPPPAHWDGTPVARTAETQQMVVVQKHRRIWPWLLRLRPSRARRAVRRRRGGPDG